MKTLFNLTADLEDLFVALQSDDPDVVVSASHSVVMTLDDYREKMAGYIAVLDELDNAANMAEAQSKRLESLAKDFKAGAAAKRAARDRLKERIMESFDAIGVSECQTELGKIRIQKGAWSLDIAEGADIPDRFVVTPEPKQRVDKKALLSAVKDGEIFEGVTASQAKQVRIYR